MDWFVGKITLCSTGKPEVEHVIVPSNNGFMGAMEQLNKWYENDMESVSLSYLASNHAVLKLSESLVNDIVDYRKDNLD